MNGLFNRHRAEREDNNNIMMTRFDEYPERRARSTSRPAPTIRSTTTSESSSPERQSTQSKPLKGILKLPSNTIDPRRREEPAVAQERSQDLLARRFYRLPRPDPLQHAPPFSQGLPQLSPLPHISPHYYSDASWGNFDTETESASSELSYNTQATSVVSEDSVPEKRTQVIHIRRVPPVSRVRTRTRSRASSDVGSTRGRRRVVNIQVIPANKEKEPAHEPSKELQLARSAERDLLERIEYLETETDNLRESRGQLSKNLHDASERLSVKEFGNREVERLLQQERAEKEYILHDLEKQRQLFDEFRSNFELQRGILHETEQERNGLQQTREKLEFQLNRVTRASKTRFEASKAAEAELARQIGTFEVAVVALEKKINTQEKEVQDLTKERDSFREAADKYQGQLNELMTERDEFRKESEAHLAKVEALSIEKETLKQEKSDLEVNLAEFQTRINGFEKEKEGLESRFEQAEADNKALHGKIQGFEEEVRILHVQIQDLEAEGTTLREQIAAVEPAKQALQKQLEDNKQAFDKQLEEDKQAFETEIAAEKAENTSQLKKLITELEGSKAANISLASQGLELQGKLATVQGDLDAAQAKVDDLEKMKESLGAEAEQLKSRAAELEGELGAKTADIEKLENRTADLEKQTLDLEQKAKELVQLQEQHKKLEEHAAELQVEMEKAQESLKAAEAAAATPTAPPSPAPSVVSVDTSILDKLTREKAELETRSRELQERIDNFPIHQTADRISALEETNKQLRVEVFRIPALEESNRVLGAEASRVPGLTQQAQNLATQLASVTQQLQQVSAAHLSASVQVGDLQATVNQLHFQEQLQQPQQQPYLQPQVVVAGSPANSTTSTTGNGTSSERRTKSRSSSRHCRTGSHERARSSSGEKLIFIRKPHDRGGITITTREALRAAKNDDK